MARQERLVFAPVDATLILEQRFSPDGKRVLLGIKDRILVYDLDKRAFGPLIRIGFDPDRYSKPAADKIPTWEVDSPAWQIAWAVTPPTTPRRARNEYPEQLLASFDVSPDGKMVAVGSCHGELRLFSTSEHQELAKIGERTFEETLVKPVAFSPDGKWLAYYLQGTLHWQTVASVLADHGSR